MGVMPPTLSQSPHLCVQSTTRHPCQDPQASTREEILVPWIPQLANMKQHTAGLMISPCCSNINEIVAKTDQVCIR